MISTLRIATAIAATLLVPSLASAQSSAAQNPAAQTQAAVTPVPQTLSPDPHHEAETIIRDYLIQHPEVLQDAMEALDKRQKEADADKARVTIKDQNATIFNSPHQVVLGNPQGNVTMVEFFDYNCAFCKRALPDMMTLLSANPNLRFVL